MSSESHDQLQRSLFAALSDLTRQVARLALHDHPGSIDQLDRCLERGAFVKVEFGIGSAGALGLNLIAVLADGQAVELACLPAPALHEPFRIGAAQTADAGGHAPGGVAQS